MTEQTYGTCPNCKGNIIEGKKGFGCANWRKDDGACRFVVWKQIMGRDISADVVVELLKNKVSAPLEGFLTQDSRVIAGKLVLVLDNGKWDVSVAPASGTGPGPDSGFDLDFDPGFDPTSGSKSGNNQEPEDLGTCPVCNGPVRESNKAFGCANWRDADGGCKFTIWKTVAQKEITRDIALHLLEHGETSLLTGFISRKGNSFSAYLKLEDDGTGLKKVIFKFEN